MRFDQFLVFPVRLGLPAAGRSVVEMWTEPVVQFLQVGGSFSHGIAPGFGVAPRKSIFACRLGRAPASGLPAPESRNRNQAGAGQFAGRRYAFSMRSVLHSARRPRRGRSLQPLDTA